MKRRNSFKQGSDPTSTSSRPILQTQTSSHSNQADSVLEPEDDFDALMLSGQTMKVSLTPNRLHTIEVAKKGQGAPVGSVRRRAGTTGMREDSASAAAAFGQESGPSPGSQMSTVKELVSRKVPWGYKRASVGAGTMIDRATTPNSDRRKSVGYQSSNGHGVLPVRSPSGMAFSENGHSPRTAAMGSPFIASSEEGPTPATSTAAAAKGNNAPTAWSGTGSQTLGRRRSFGSRPLSMAQAHRKSLNLETIQLLADLERAMRNCHSVDECRALVHKAMHSDGAASALSDSQVNGVTDEKETQEEGKATGAAGHANGAVPAGASLGSVATAAEVVTASETTATPDRKLPDVKRLDANRSTSLEQVDQGLIVAWLLGGDEGPTSTRDVASDKLSALPQRLSQEQAATSKGSAAEQPASLDSSASRDATRGRASSSVASVQSNYKDAHEEVMVE
uniref:Uncharacterized protein n=1 Tax=Kalmanozyma brasiliensis (strain GHG001) TaxID=1365824 RepID=V5EVI1_KALBG